MKKVKYVSITFEDGTIYNFKSGVLHPDFLKNIDFYCNVWYK